MLFFSASRLLALLFAKLRFIRFMHIECVAEVVTKALMLEVGRVVTNLQ